MFFEAPSIGCRKTIFDVTRVTYNMYSCDISYMSREMIEMDGQDRATCQNPNKWNMDGILEFVNDNKTNF